MAFCYESGQELPSGEVVFACGRTKYPIKICPVSREIIWEIPKAVRFYKPTYETDLDGLDIYRFTPNAVNAPQLGDFVFSLNAANAQHYLPELSRAFGIGTPIVRDLGRRTAWQRILDDDE